MPAWAALRASSVESRFDALHTTGLAALVGRDEELELLLRRRSKAKTGEGHVMLLSGEAGIGKSGLTAALLQRLSGEPHTRLRYFCSSQHTDSAFHPIIGQLERAAGLAYDDKPQVKLDKLDAVLAQSSTSKARMPHSSPRCCRSRMMVANGFHEAPEWIDQPHIYRELQALAEEVRKGGEPAPQEGLNRK